MREQLITPEVYERRRFQPLRGGEGEEVVALGGCGACCVIMFLFYTIFGKSLGPNEYGLYRNFLTGEVSHEVVRGGLYFPGPIWGFMKYPAAQITLEFSRRSLDRGPVMTRTGAADARDPDSGGQQIAITCALQIEYVPEKIYDVYMTMGQYAVARDRNLLIANNVISNTAQKYTPQDFWKKRNMIAMEMLHQINDTLFNTTMVIAKRFEILKIDFPPSFERTITAIQISEQQRVVNEYEQQVQQVVQSIAVMQADNDALIANISAGADAASKEICAGATRDAFKMKQQMKAKKYKELQDTLDLDGPNMREYFKIKAVQSQTQKGKAVVGVPRIGSSGVPQHKA